MGLEDKVRPCSETEWPGHILGATARPHPAWTSRSPRKWVGGSGGQRRAQGLRMLPEQLCLISPPVVLFRAG